MNGIRHQLFYTRTGEITLLIKTEELKHVFNSLLIRVPILLLRGLTGVLLFSQPSFIKLCKP